MRSLVVLLALALAFSGCLAGSSGPPAETSSDGPASGSAGDESGNDSGTDPGAEGSGPAAGGNGSEDNDTGPRPGDTVDEGHITVGSPTTYFCSLTVCADQEGIESFLMEEVPPPGTVIGTNTTDSVGAGFNLDLYFHTADGDFLGGCDDRPAPGTAGEQTCEVPEEAASGTVDAVWGADLDVVVVVVEAP